MKDVKRLIKNEQSYVDKVSTLEKSLSEETSKNKTLTKICEELHASESRLAKELNVVKKSCVDLQQSLEKSQMFVLNVRDMYFGRDKDQVICLYPTLDISSVDFFKSIVDGKLVDMDAEDSDGSSVTNGPDGNDASQADVTK
ncbi:hypothetical protein RYX36_011161 [Vicia faba]